MAFSPNECPTMQCQSLEVAPIDSRGDIYCIQCIVELGLLNFLLHISNWHLALIPICNDSRKDFPGDRFI